MTGPGKQLLEIVAPDNPDDESFRTFVLHNEDHTLGNSLRYMIMKNPDVEFCGYSIPHPSENKINLRIQVLEKKNGEKGKNRQSPPSATDVLRKGLTDLCDVCEHILNTFEHKVARYKRHQSKGQPMDTT